MPVHSVVTDREYREACGRLRGIIRFATRTDLSGSFPTRPSLQRRISNEIGDTIAHRELRKADHSRLEAYAAGLVDQMEVQHTERRCWHSTSRTWRPAAEGSAYKLGRLPAEAGEYAPDLTVTFWKPQPGDVELKIYSGAVPDDYGTRYSTAEAPAARRFVAMAISEAEAQTGAFPPDTFVLALPGRHGAGQVDALFTKSGLIDGRALVHHPFLVFVYTPTMPGMVVRMVKTVAEVLDYSDDTPAMLQWPGQWRSDWFHFTVGDLRDHLNRKAETAETRGE